MKKIISFDLDGTIMKPGFGDIVWLEGLPKAYAKDKQIPLDVAKTFLINAYETIGSDKREWYDLSYWIETLNLSITPDSLLHEYKQIITPYPDAKKVIKRLSEDYTLIVSSGAMKEFIHIELTSADLHQYFDYFFSSTSDSDTVKKDPSFYQKIATSLKVKPEDIIHVGDHREYDYLSPTSAGLIAYYLERDQKIKAPYVVSSLNEFEKKVRNIE